MDALFSGVDAPESKGKKPARKWAGLIVTSSGEVLSNHSGEDQQKVMALHKVAIDRARRNGRKSAYALFGELVPL